MQYDVLVRAANVYAQWLAVVDSQGAVNLRLLHYSSHPYIVEYYP
jgi:hypothetical protein